MAAKTADEIQAWLVCQLTEIQQTSPERIDIHESFTNFDLDSVAELGLTLEMESWLGRSLPDGIFWDYPTIESLAQYLASEE